MFNFDQLVESILQEKRYKVTHIGLGISGETSVDIEDEKKAKSKAKQNVFFGLKSKGKINNDAAYRWKEATATPLQEKKQMHCWRGYKKKGTKKLPSGKVVNNCIKNV
jgi:hypothetical protein